MTYQPLFIIDAVKGLGFGEQMVVVAALVLFVLYLFRARKYGGAITNILGTAWLLGVAIAIVFVLVIAFGWADPNPSAFASDMLKAGQTAIDTVKGPIDDMVMELADRVQGEFS